MFDAFDSGRRRVELRPDQKTRVPMSPHVMYRATPPAEPFADETGLLIDLCRRSIPAAPMETLLPSRRMHHWLDFAFPIRERTESGCMLRSPQSKRNWVWMGLGPLSQRSVGMQQRACENATVRGIC